MMAMGRCYRSAEDNCCLHILNLKEGLDMNIMRGPMALLIFTIIGLGGCAHEWSSMADPHPVTAADLQAVLRDE